MSYSNLPSRPLPISGLVRDEALMMADAWGHEVGVSRL